MSHPTAAMARPAARLAALVACAATLAPAEGAGAAGAWALPSEGCSGERPPPRHRHGQFRRHDITVPDFRPVRRSFFVEMPPGEAAGGGPAAPAPLLLGFHGQTEKAAKYARSHKFGMLGAIEGLISVWPQGMGDAMPDQDQGTGWNVGQAGMDGNATCIPKGVGNLSGCYESCQELRRCGRCNWSTCYDDVLFVRQVIDWVSKDLCIDLNRVYAMGESNGGMLVAHLVRELPGTFAAVSPWYGTPLLGFLLGPKMQLLRHHAEMSKTALLTLHGRSDVTIPPGGGMAYSGWLFEAEAEVRDSWAALHGCAAEAEALSTIWDGGEKHFACREHKRCRSGRRVIGCRYDGAHGDWPQGLKADEITLWFFFQFSRGAPAGGEPGLVV